MDWQVVADWLVSHRYVVEDWDNIEVTDVSVYCSDKNENTFISVFENGGYVVLFVGSLNPKISVGGDTDRPCNTPWDAIDYMQDYLDEYWDNLDRKIYKHMKDHKRPYILY